MALTGKWRELHRHRFPELPEDCGEPARLSDNADLRDWSRKATTPDQYRIERYIDGFDLREKRILHIGIGNSGLAQRFQDRVGEIVGTTVDEPEIELARSLGFANYRVAMHNKYSGQDHAAPGHFDLVIDNNLTSPCCCIAHLAELFRFFESKIAEGGQIVTDREGLAWIPAGSNPRWSFDFADLAAVASAAGLDAWPINRNVYVLCHGQPEKAALTSRFRSTMRKARSFANRIIRRGPRKIVSRLRNIA